MGRSIGVSYRTKKTVVNAARPTLVAIKNGEHIACLELQDEDNELDFAKGQLVVEYAVVGDDEDISSYSPHHCRWREVKKDEDLTKLNEKHTRKVGKGREAYLEICTHVPLTFDGVREGDTVVMCLGAGNYLAGLLFIKGSKIGVTVHRVSPMYLKAYRTEKADDDKDRDHVTLLGFFEESKKLFYQMRQPDKALINVALKLELRQQAQQERIAYGNQLRQSLMGRVFLDEEQELHGTIKDQCAAMMINDQKYERLVQNEKLCDRDLEAAVHATDVWPIFEEIPGVGPRIFAGFVSPIGDLRRFMVPVQHVSDGPITDHEKFRWEQYRDNGPHNTFYGKMLIEKGVVDLSLEEYSHKVRRHKAWSKSMQKGAAKLMKFCGVHTMPSDSALGSPDPDFYRVFPRHKTGEVGNWSPAARQALYLLVDQFNRRPGSCWGKKLVDFKTGFREKHPEVIKCDKKLTKIYRSLELFFRIKAGVMIQPQDNKIDSVEALQVWFAACFAKIEDKGRFADEVQQWQQQISKATVEGKTVKLFTPGHLLRMAKWRTLTRFVRWVFFQWAKIETTVATGA